MGALAVAVTVALAGCTPAQQRGFLPGDSQHEVTNQTGRIVHMWTGSWIALVLVGLLVWGLAIWCAVAYRRRKNDTGYPIQLRYHVPLEMIFTLLPVVMIMSMFYFTQRDTAEVEAKTAKPDYTVNVVGKQWSWDFNYVDQDVHEAPGVQSFETGTPGAEKSLPTLWLPVNKSVRFKLDSRDVAHSFWVTDFLYKKDMFPGHTTQFEVTPTKEGTYKGKCAELCGEFHSDMLFNVKVVSQAEFDKHMQELKDKGQTGQLSVDLNRNQEPWNMREKADKADQKQIEKGGSK